jgi:hypothetical protein
MYNSIKSCIVYNDNKSDFFSSEDHIDFHSTICKMTILKLQWLNMGIQYDMLSDFCQKIKIDLGLTNRNVKV